MDIKIVLIIIDIDNNFVFHFDNILFGYLLQLLWMLRLLGWLSQPIVNFVHQWLFSISILVCILMNIIMCVLMYIIMCVFVHWVLMFSLMALMLKLAPILPIWMFWLELAQIHNLLILLIVVVILFIVMVIVIVWLCVEGQTLCLVYSLQLHLWSRGWLRDHFLQLWFWFMGS